MELNPKLFKPLFHESWWNKIEKFFELLDPIYLEIKAQSDRQKEIFPIWEDVFNAFKYTDFDKMKAVVCGIAPYHTKYKREIIADGIALSCSKTGVEHPSLTKWYDAMERDFKGESIKRETDLKYLCEEGVFMFNMSLTVEANKSLSHNRIWQPFIKAVFENCIAPSGVPVILLGDECKIAEKWIAPFQWCFRISHPESAAYTDSDWDSQGVFKKVQRIVKDNTGEDLKWFL